MLAPVAADEALAALTLPPPPEEAGPPKPDGGLDNVIEGDVAEEELKEGPRRGPTVTVEAVVAVVEDDEPVAGKKPPSPPFPAPLPNATSHASGEVGTDFLPAAAAVEEEDEKDVEVLIVPKSAEKEKAVKDEEGGRSLGRPVFVQVLQSNAPKSPPAAEEEPRPLLLLPLCC
jgi:hypothetical protein